jgi:hypothetical protein
MLKILVVLLPMVAGASLAGAARAATPIDISAQPATVSVQGAFAGLSSDSVHGFTAHLAQVAAPTAGLEIVGRNTSRLPEPATWAIMLTGFGLVGAAARHRRAQRLA